MTILTALATLLSMQDLLAGSPLEHVSKEDSSGVEVREIAGTPVLSVDEGRVRFRRLPVKSATKYAVTVECEFEGDVESLEDNPRLEIFTHPGRTSPRLPVREIRFYDAKGKMIGRVRAGSMAFRARRPYVDMFYTPRGAESLEIALSARSGIRLGVHAVTLEPAKDEGALNSNPAFKLGLANYSGWENISRGGKLIERNGKAVLDTKYGSTTRRFPIPGPGRYGFSARATGNGFNSVVRIRVYDAEGKKLLEMATRNYGPVVEFVAPKDADSASFLVYSCLLEEVRLVRLGDE